MSIGIVTARQLKKENPKTEKARIEKFVPVSFPMEEPKQPETVYKLYDPEKRTFRDKIRINGIEKERTVIEGVLKTTDRELMNFHLTKGWIMLPVESLEEV